MIQHKKFLGFRRRHIVGLTGGIGCGKSLVRTMFEAVGAPCIDADRVARVIHQNPAHPATKQIAEAFPDMVDDSGALKRGGLQSLFAIDQMANHQLKAILKPHVMDAICRWTEDQRSPYVVWESALLLDENIPVDRVLVVDASEERRIARIRNRNPEWTEGQIQRILAIQMPRAAYLARAQDVLSNNEESETELRQQVEAIHRQYVALWG